MITVTELFYDDNRINVWRAVILKNSHITNPCRTHQSQTEPRSQHLRVWIPTWRRILAVNYVSQVGNSIIFSVFVIIYWHIRCSIIVSGLNSSPISLLLPNYGLKWFLIQVFLSNIFCNDYCMIIPLAYVNLTTTWFWDRPI